MKFKAIYIFLFVVYREQEKPKFCVSDVRLAPGMHPKSVFLQ